MVFSRELVGDTPENRARAAHQGTLDRMDGMVARRVELEDALQLIRMLTKAGTDEELTPLEEAVKEVVDRVLGDE